VKQNKLYAEAAALALIATFLLSTKPTVISFMQFLSKLPAARLRRAQSSRCGESPILRAGIVILIAPGFILSSGEKRGPASESAALVLFGS
jgi:hypothetical protein